MDKKKKRRKRRAFTPEFKAEAVRLCAVGDRSIAHVADDLDLTESALRGWVQRAEIDAGKGPPEALNTAEREELAKLRRDNKRLTMERDILKAAATFFAGERMKFAFIAARDVAFPVAVMCRLLGVTRSGFYAWAKRPKPARAKSDAQLAATVAAVHHRSRRTYGSPRVHRELLAHGVRVGKKRVERLMRENGIQGRAKRRFKHTTNSKHGGPIARNLLAREFQVSAPNRVWVTDVTAITTGEGWLYPAPMLDLHSRRVVGWSVSDSNDTELALDVPRKALGARKPPPGLLHHSDRGSPYASDDYRAELRARGLRRSMSRKGDCWDNAVAESFFATLRAELVDHERYATRDAATKSIGDYIDNFYNVERRHSHLGYLNPIEFASSNCDHKFNNKWHSHGVHGNGGASRRGRPRKNQFAAWRFCFENAERVA